MHTFTDQELDMFTEAVIKYGPIEPCRDRNGNVKRWSVCFVDYSNYGHKFVIFFFNSLDGMTHCVRRAAGNTEATLSARGIEQVQTRSFAHSDTINQ